MAAISERSILNVNIGLLGHIDCGKTSLARSLSSKMSTACFDKHPQSQERGITLDLGFSAFFMPPSESMKRTYPALDQLQVTLVDCPGHASLIKTIISGAQIIDLMLLVIDVTKGLQTQTAECLVIGEITCNQLIVVLNKIDLLPEPTRSEAIEKMTRRMKKTLEKTKFAEAQIIPVSATEATEKDSRQKWGIEDLIAAIRMDIKPFERDSSGAFMFAIDHCFSIKGQGTVMTGTVIQGSVKVNEIIEISSLSTKKKVKSIQMFKEPITSAMQGDRIGICVTQFDSKNLERGIAASPGYLELCYCLVVSLKRIQYYKGIIENRTKFHITILHETVLGRIELFTGLIPFDPSCEYLAIDSYEERDVNNEEVADNVTYALIHLERPVIASKGSLIIGSKLDTAINVNTCRLAFHGTVLHKVTDKDYVDNWLPSLSLYKIKTKKGSIERIPDEYEAIANIFKKETNIATFKGFEVTFSTGEIGFIDGSFGQKGKVKIRIPDGIKDKSLISKSSKISKFEKEITVSISFKRYIHDKEKRVMKI